MKTSAVGQKFTANQEWVPRSRVCGWDPVRQLYFPYRDYRGNWTFGVGHLLRQSDDFSRGATEERVMQVFAADLIPVEQAIDEYVKVPLSQNAFDALVDFGFNEGPLRLDPERNTAIRVLNTGHYELVPQLLEAWCVSSGQHDPNLLRRRKAEGVLFMTPDPPADATTDDAKLAYAKSFGLFDLLPDHPAIEDDDVPPTVPNA